jgi:hypothetical protein
MKRRTFLKLSFAACLVPFLSFKAQAILYTAADQKLYENKINLAQQNNWAALPFNQLVVMVAQSFIGTPYVGGTLDRTANEELIINLHEVDCFTYLEYVLALARVIKWGRTSFEDFCAQVQFMRYRAGQLNGYASRLHYFTDWLADNHRKKVVQVIAGPSCEKKQLNILSQNLKNQQELAAVREMELRASQQGFCYFGNQILNKKEIQSYFRDGDIIGFVSNVKGLDINHVAFLKSKPAGGWTYIHASSVNKAVEVYAKDLVEYALRIKRNTGIVLARASS